jgi:hypothetical protein
VPVSFWSSQVSCCQCMLTSPPRCHAASACSHHLPGVMLPVHAHRCHAASACSHHLPGQCMVTPLVVHAAVFCSPTSSVIALCLQVGSGSSEYREIVLLGSWTPYLTAEPCVASGAPKSEPGEQAPASRIQRRWPYAVLSSCQAQQGQQV